MGDAVARDDSMPPAHPAAERFPLMQEAELEQLAEDIAKHGQRQPIIQHEGQILDGRNRWLACLRRGIEPKTTAWDGRGSAVAFILSANLYRRHLGPPERASISIDMLPHFQTEARERMRLGGVKSGEARRGEGGDNSAPPSGPRDESQRAIAQAAKACGVSVGSVKSLLAVKKAAPEVFELAQQGKVNVAEAKRLTALPDPERKQAVAEAAERGRPRRRVHEKLNQTARNLLEGSSVAADRTQLRQLARLPATTQKEVARRIAAGSEATVGAAKEALIANAPLSPRLAATDGARPDAATEPPPTPSADAGRTVAEASTESPSPPPPDQAYEHALAVGLALPPDGRIRLARALLASVEESST